MNKFYVNVATGVQGECAADSEDSIHDEFEVHFDSKERAEKFDFLAQVSGTRMAGSLESPKSIREAQKVLANLVNTRDYVGLRELVTKRSTAPLYLQALKKRTKARLELDQITERAEKLRARTKLVDKKAAAQASLDYRDAALEFRAKYEDMKLQWARLDEYRVINAQAALASSILQEEAERAAGTFLEYDGASIGDLESIGEYEINSPEWHAARAAGIGGSDVGAIMRVEKEWASANYSRVVNAKLGLDDPMQRSIDPQDLRTGIGRGNAWEEYIRYTITEKNPDLRVAFCKTSWHSSKVSYRHANFDGLILNAFGIPEGIIEIKTGSDVSKWGPESAGLDGVPAGYRKQVLWYAMNGDLKYGKIVAVLDDYDYREYDFTMDDPAIQAELQEMIDATDEFWVDMQDKRQKLAAGLPISRKKAKRGMKTTHDYDNIAEVFAGYAGVPLEEAKREIIDTIEAEKAAKGRLLSDTEFQRSAVAIFAKHDPTKRSKPLIGVDLETTTTSPRTGRIIETGIARLTQDGNTEVVYSSLHDIPERAKAAVGLGQFSIHRISADMIEGLPSFDDPAEQEKILTLLKSGTLVAHNAGFEDRWFSANLPGYVEAKNAGEITILDTRRLSSFLMLRSDDSSLQSFAEDNGIPYEGAHAATADAVMMMKALSRLQTSLFKNGTFRVKRISEAARRKAQEKVLASHDDR